MAYIKKIWKDYPDTSTPITADDLNNIENGIGLKLDISSKASSAEAQNGTDDNKYITPKSNKESITVNSSQIKFPNGIKISYGSALHSFAGSGVATKEIDISGFNYTTIYSVQITTRLTYADVQYMKDSAWYLHSFTTTTVRVNLVNAYPSTIGYNIDYLIIGV